MIHVPKVAQLVNDEIVDQVHGQEQQGAVEAYSAPGRAAAPPRALPSHAHGIGSQPDRLRYALHTPGQDPPPLPQQPIAQLSSGLRVANRDPQPTAMGPLVQDAQPRLARQILDSPDTAAGTQVDKVRKGYRRGGPVPGDPRQSLVDPAATRGDKRLDFARRRSPRRDDLDQTMGQYVDRQATGTPASTDGYSAVGPAGLKEVQLSGRGFQVSPARCRRNG